MAAPLSTGLGQLGRLPLELRVRIYELALIAEGTTFAVHPYGELQSGDLEQSRPLERTYTMQSVSASIAHEINSLHIPSSVCTFVVDNPHSLEALLRALASRGGWVRNLEIRSTYHGICKRCHRDNCIKTSKLDEQLAVARTSYSVWKPAFEMLGPRVRNITIDVKRDLWYMKDRKMIKKRIVKLAAMAAKISEGRARVKVQGGCLVPTEQRFLEEGVQGVVPGTLGWPYETYGGGRATVEQIEAELAELRERAGEYLVSELMGGR